VWPQTQSPRRGRLLRAGLGGARRRERAAPFGGFAGRGVGSQGSLRSPWATSCLAPVRGLRMGCGRARSAQTPPPPTQGRWGARSRRAWEGEAPAEPHSSARRRSALLTPVLPRWYVLPCSLC
jgi:hypothetical protein